MKLVDIDARIRIAMRVLIRSKSFLWRKRGIRLDDPMRTGDG